jgi:hypothetical protein
LHGSIVRGTVFDGDEPILYRALRFRLQGQIRPHVHGCACDRRTGHEPHLGDGLLDGSNSA